MSATIHLKITFARFWNLNMRGGVNVVVSQKITSTAKKLWIFIIGANDTGAAAGAGAGAG